MRRRRRRIINEAVRLGLVVPGMEGYIPMRDRPGFVRSHGWKTPYFWEITRGAGAASAASPAGASAAPGLNTGGGLVSPAERGREGEVDDDGPNGATSQDRLIDARVDAVGSPPPLVEAAHLTTPPIRPEGADEDFGVKDLLELPPLDQVVSISSRRAGGRADTAQARRHLPARARTAERLPSFRLAFHAHRTAGVRHSPVRRSQHGDRAAVPGACAAYAAYAVYAGYAGAALRHRCALPYPSSADERNPADAQVPVSLIPAPEEDVLPPKPISRIPYFPNFVSYRKEQFEVRPPRFEDVDALGGLVGESVDVVFAVRMPAAPVEAPPPSAVDDDDDFEIVREWAGLELGVTTVYVSP